MFVVNLLALTGLLGATASAHFVVKFPHPMGYDDVREGEWPCGSFDPLNFTTDGYDWPVPGHPVYLLSTHSSVNWEIKAALYEEGAQHWVHLVRPFYQTGTGEICFPGVPGNPNWIGAKAIVQITQHASDGALYQCIQVTFKDDGPMDVPAICKNDAGVSHEPLIGIQTPGMTTGTAIWPGKVSATDGTHVATNVPQPVPTSTITATIAEQTTSTSTTPAATTIGGSPVVTPTGTATINTSGNATASIKTATAEPEPSAAGVDRTISCAGVALAILAGVAVIAVAC